MLDGVNSNSSIPQGKIYRMEDMNFKSLNEKVLFCEKDLSDGNLEGYLNEAQYKEYSEEIVAANQEENKAKSVELKGKTKPSFELTEPNKEPTLAKDEDAFYTKPSENTFVMFNGHKILYKDGQYSVPDRNDIEPNKSIYAIRSVIINEKNEKARSQYESAMQQATSNEEKRVAVDNLIKDISSWHESFSYDVIKNNYMPGETAKTVNYAGLNIRFTVSEDFKPIIDMEDLYRQANCLDD